MDTYFTSASDDAWMVAWRLGLFAVIFVSLAGLETLFALRRKRAMNRSSRWLSAFGLVTLSSVLTRFILPMGLVGLALWGDGAGFGLFHSIPGLPFWAVFAATLILLDLAVWFQHFLTHRVDVLWRLHRVHHADPDIDVTTAIRFHPIEMALSALWKAAVVIALGAPALAVFVFELALNALAQFNHANLALPPRVERVLRWVIVTPHMHRVHHSVFEAESLKNYGFCLSVWDRLFGQYQAEAKAGLADMRFGQPDWRDVSDQRLDRLLVQPIKGSQASN